MAFIDTIPYRVRPAYVWYLRAQTLEGIFIGAVYQMIQFVGRKTVGISELEVSLFQFFIALGMFCSFLFPAGLNLRSQKQFILWANVPCKLLFLLLAWVSHPFWFFCIASAALFLSKMSEPMKSSLLKTNYPSSHRFRIVSHVRMIELVCVMIASALAGFWMDSNGERFRILFPLAALAGIAGVWMFMHIREKTAETSTKLIPIRRFIQVILRDKVYMRYQLLFSISGLVNLMGIPLYVLYTVDVIQATYWEISLSRGVFFGLCSILTMRWWGRLMDRYPNPILMRAFLSLIWCLHPLCYVFAVDMTLIYIAEAWFGVLMAGGQLNWMLGPLYFCSNEDAPLYTVVHAVVNGIRGMLAPLLGYLLYTWFGFIPVFWMISLVMLINSFMIYGLYLKTRGLKRFHSHAL